MVVGFVKLTIVFKRSKTKRKNLSERLHETWNDEHSERFLLCYSGV